MFLNTVVLFLQEILEASLLISVLLVLTGIFHRTWGLNFVLRRSWATYALLLGCLGAWAYAAITPTVSEWFDYVGQDILNSLIHLVSLLFLITLACIVPSRFLQDDTSRRTQLTSLSMVVIVLLSLMRGGSELILYLLGVLGQAGNTASVFSGAAIGVGIGLSCGVILFYALTSLHSKWSLRVCVVLLGLIGGNMASQIIMLLSQADWLPYTPVAWNSSVLITETSIPGRLLYALVGYESTPSVLQVICYLMGVAIILMGPLFRLAWLTQQQSPGEK